MSLYPSTLTKDNYVVYAMHHYDNPQCCSIEEFQNDLNRIRYLKRLFNKYKTHGDLKERLILNHIIIFYNVFGIEAATYLLFLNIEEEYYSYLKSFLVFLNYVPQEISDDSSFVEIPIDYHIRDTLRSI